MLKLKIYWSTGRDFIWDWLALLLVSHYKKKPPKPKKILAMETSDLWLYFKHQDNLNEKEGDLMYPSVMLKMLFRASE